MDEFNKENIVSDNVETEGFLPVENNEIPTEENETTVLDEIKTEHIPVNDYFQSEETCNDGFDDKKEIELEKINYGTPIDAMPVTTEAPDKLGIKIFSLVLVFVIVLCGVFTGGYYLGKNHKKTSYGGTNSLLLE